MAIMDRNYSRKRGKLYCSFHDVSKRQVTQERRTVTKVLRDGRANFCHHLKIKRQRKYL